MAGKVEVTEIEDVETWNAVVKDNEDLNIIDVYAKWCACMCEWLSERTAAGAKRATAARGRHDVHLRHTAPPTTSALPPCSSLHRLIGIAAGTAA